MRSMKYSSPLSKVFLPTTRDGSPPLSPRNSLRAIGIMQAVTLACTAAFAAASTALLFILFLSSQSNNGSLLGINDWYNNAATVKCDDTHGQQVNDISPDVDSEKISAISKATSKIMTRYSRRSILPDNNVEVKKAKTEPSSSWPEGAIWLMSFPNSGTSYTLHTVREVTNTTTATNYGLEGDIKDEESVPAFQDGLDGPFLELIPERHTTLPRLIITKTHCGGFSTSLNPNNYIETPRSFLKSCLKGKRGVYSLESKSFTTHSVWYSQNLIRKIVHIFRSPLDNVVARFHLERKRFTKKKNEKWLNEYPNTKDGFRRWCKRIDDSPRQLAQTRWIDSGLATAFSGVPCHAEFYRYVQWHNLAHTVQAELDVPTFVFYYEDYSTRFDDVTKELMSFLELEPKGVAPDFIENKQYGDYYSVEQARAIAALVEELSTKQTWKHLAHYFGKQGVESVEKKEKTEKISETNQGAAGS